jgi:hypothetical protein
MKQLQTEVAVGWLATLICIPNVLCSINGLDATCSVIVGFLILSWQMIQLFLKTDDGYVLPSQMRHTAY